MNKPNVALVVFDTLRWDYFDYFIKSDPVIFDHIGYSLNFKWAYTPSPWTLPSHFSLFTGLYPSEHGIQESPDSEMEEIFKKARNYSGNFLSKTASLNGYETIGISANPMISGLT